MISRLTVVDTPGFGDAIDNTDSFQQIIKYIDDQFERYLKDESGLNRKNIIDNRVHCCYYFISPYGHGLKPLDIDFMRKLSNKVNILFNSSLFFINLHFKVNLSLGTFSAICLK